MTTKMLAQTEELKAGRELDARVAEVVMQWRWMRRQRMKVSCCAKPAPIGEPTRFLVKPGPSPISWYGENEYSNATGDEAIDETFIESVPHYSTDIKAAWEVAEKMVSDGHVFIVKGDGLRAGDFSPRWTVLCDNLPRTDADSAPLAICLAALAACEEK